jgi:hypothetical protein
MKPSKLPKYFGEIIDKSYKKAIKDPFDSNHCLQCGRTLDYWEGLGAWVCHAPGCPCFGLLQLGVEYMQPAIMKSRREKK